MAEVNKGAAVCWGVGGITATGAVISATATAVQGVDFNRNADKASIKDENGSDVGVCYYNLNNTATITVIPMEEDAAPDQATAYANALAVLKTPGTTVTVTDSNSIVSATQSGKFNVDSARIAYTNEGAAVVTLEISQNVDNDLTIAVT